MRTKKRKYLEIFYDANLKNWDEVINRELKRLGLERGSVTVIARPRKRKAYPAKKVFVNYPGQVPGMGA